MSLWMVAPPSSSFSSQEVRQLSNIHSNAPHLVKGQHATKPLEKPHVAIVTRYETVVFCEPQAMIKALCGAVCTLEDNPKVVSGHCEHRTQSPIRSQNFADRASGLFLCHGNLLPCPRRPSIAAWDHAPRLWATRQSEWLDAALLSGEDIAGGLQEDDDSKRRKRIEEQQLCPRAACEVCEVIIRQKAV